MSSSRWKRFAFFDRHSLTIPNEVLEDLIPAVKSSTISSGSALGDGQQQDTVNNDDTATAAAASKASVKRSLRTLTIAGQEASAESDVVSTILTTAALPLLSKPVVGLLNKNNPTNDNINQQQQPQTQSSALDAMWMSLTACSPLDGNNNAYLNSIELPNQGQQSYFPQQQKTSTSKSDTTSTAGTNAIDGLVLCFVTSHNTQLVHCFDLTVRCNPPRKQQQQPLIGGGGTGSGTATGTDISTTKRSSNSTVPLPSEDMDGWRGYFAPFFPQLLSSSTPTTTTTSSPTIIPSIVSMASCRCIDRHRPLHVACITNQHVVVWEDPHLHLLYRRPLSTSSATITPPSDAIIYTTVPVSRGGVTPNTTQSSTYQQQNQLWNTESGQYRVVDIIPGIVAIGTSAGTVLVYVYTSTDTKPSNNNNSSTTTTRKYLRPYLRIPSPPGTNGTIEVISIKLTQVNDRKVNAFVSYNRKSSTASTSNLNIILSSTTPGGTTTANNNNQSTVGICCYEIPLSSTTTTATATAYTQTANVTNMLSGPSARHDLDGRYVTSSNLVDTSSTTTIITPTNRDVSNNDTTSTSLSTTTDKIRLIVVRSTKIIIYPLKVFA
jgi:hypothetical protein